MPRQEREKLLLHIVELRQTLSDARSDDLRETLAETLSLCVKRLAELDELIGSEAT